MTNGDKIKISMKTKKIKFQIQTKWFSDDCALKWIECPSKKKKCDRFIEPCSFYTRKKFSFFLYCCYLKTTATKSEQRMEKKKEEKNKTKTVCCMFVYIVEMKTNIIDSIWAVFSLFFNVSNWILGLFSTLTLSDRSEAIACLCYRCLLRL